MKRSDLIKLLEKLPGKDPEIMFKLAQGSVMEYKGITPGVFMMRENDDVIDDNAGYVILAMTNKGRKKSTVLTVGTEFGTGKTID